MEKKPRNVSVTTPQGDDAHDALEVGALSPGPIDQGLHLAVKSGSHGSPRLSTAHVLQPHGARSWPEANPQVQMLQR